ncbi:MAG: TPM domain-containing protein, partial [Firmicutes bacterium]|nr:TPM domain-containing protein [Bacillota bacterium]
MKKGMKYIVALFVMLTTITSNITLAFAKDENWNDTIYHLTDPNEVLTEEEFKEENKLVTQAITDTEFDIATFIVDDHFFAKMGFSAYLSAIYQQNEMGYGVNHDGIVLGIDTTNEEFLIKTFGRGNEIFKKDEFEQLQNIIEQSYQKGSILTAQQSYRESVVEIVEESSEWVSLFEEDYPAGYEMEPTSLVTGAASQTTPSQKEEIVLPDWYVKDPSTFKDFHNDKNTPRLIDNADIFTEEEEAQIAPRLKEILDT